MSQNQNKEDHHTSLVKYPKRLLFCWHYFKQEQLVQ